MKSISFLVIYSLIFNISSIGQCFIQGRFKNYEGDNFVIIQKPINNFFNTASLDSTDTITINNNYFYFKVNCNKPVFICIVTAGNYINLIATPKDSILISLDYSKYTDSKKVNCTFSGANAKGHQLFYEYNDPPINKFHKIWQILKTARDESIISEIKEEISEQLSPFRDLLLKKEIGVGYYSLMNTTITALLLFETIRKIGDFNITNLRLPEMKRMAIISKLFTLLSPYDRNIYYGYLSNNYSSIYFAFLRSQRLKTKGLYDQPDTCFEYKKKVFNLNGSFAPLLSIKDPSLKEFLIGTKIINYLAVGGSVILKDEISYFSYQYPKSFFRSIIIKYKEIKEFERKSFGANYKEYFDKISPLIIDTIGNIKSFDFSKYEFLKDSLLYVDIWATWCAPCLREMQFNYKVDSFLYYNNISRLYISIDNPSQQKKWENLINEMHLGGYHILAGTEFNKFLSNTIGLSEGLIAIPRYLIIKSGKILINDAARPSDFEDLKVQIEQILKNNSK